MDDVRGLFLGMPHGTTPAAVTTNKNMIMSSFKSSGNNGIWWANYHKKHTFFLVSVFKCLTLKTVHGRKIFHTWEEIERLVAEKKVDVTQVVTHRFPMSQFEEAFKVLFDGSACKIIMDPSK